MKKNFSILITLLLTLSLVLSACGGDDTESSSTPDVGSSTISVESNETSEETSDNISEEASGATSEETSEDESTSQESSETSAESESSVADSSEDVSEESESVADSSESEDESSMEIIESSEQIPESTEDESSVPDDSSVTPPAPDGTTEYSVKLIAPDGTPCKSGVVVKFMENGTQVAMQVPNSDGVVKKVLQSKEYTVELAFTGTAFKTSANASLKLTASKPSITINFLNELSGTPTDIYPSGEEKKAYNVTVGATYVPLTAGERNYFLFAPTVAGTYKFTTDSKDAAIGYYGGPHFIQSTNLSEIKDNAFEMSISASSISTGGAGTTVLVLGVDAAAGVKDCALIITRIGDAKKTLADYPWNYYEATVEISKYSLPAGTKLTDFDLTAESVNLVFNEKDGFYHLNKADGPLVYVYLTVDPAYMACFKTILDRSAVTRYFYDDDGNFVKKVDYGTCLAEYIECADEKSGVYPLTKDLEHIIKERGEYVGWWDISSSGYIFVDRNNNPDSSINPDIAWLFMCCYAE